jgi:4-amino-4-deoxy-L-arabinose transferase-like glycosyltransferase
VKRSSILILILVAIFSLVLRIYNVASTPPSLNQDEVALGYNAYSFLKTGKDEHGVFLPTYIKSFGDWKFPTYSYLDVPFIAVFGLTELAVRLPSIIAGVLSTILVFCIVDLLFKKKQISIISSILFAISPWSIYFSRAAYEVNVGLFFFLLGLFFYLKYISVKKNMWLLGISAFSLIMTMFLYHSFLLFTPLFICSLLFINRRKMPFKELIIFTSVIILFSLLAFYNVSHTNTDKISNLSIFNNENVIYDRAEKLRGDGSEQSELISKVLYNKYSAGIYQLAQNYLSTYSPTFLFDKGGEKTVHNLGYFGNLYIFDVLLLAVGMFFLIWYREKNLPLILIWFLLGPIPSSLTPDPQNSTRLYVLLPVFIFVSSYGAYQIIHFLFTKDILRLSTLFVLTVIFIVNVTLFLNGYFVHMNTQRARFWHYGYKEIALLAQKYPEHNIVFRGPENFPYIYFLFYNAYSPEKFRDEVEYYPVTSEGFQYVKSFGKYYFPPKIDYANLSEQSIYIDDYISKKGESAPENSITLPSGEAIFTYTIVK